MRAGPRRGTPGPRRGTPGPRRGGPLLAGVTAVAIVLGGCGAAATAAPGGRSVPGASATPSAGIGSASPVVPSITASVPTSAAESPAASPAITLDTALLDLLPAQLDGLDRQHDPSIEAGAFADPTLPGIATAGITALYIDPATAEFAYAVVIRLKPAGLTDAQFRSWRDTFDVGACAQAGGIGGHAESTIGGHDTFIGTCTGGLRTYHTILAGRGLLVSVSSVGDRRLGERLIGALPS